MTNEQEKPYHPDIGWCPCCNRAVVELPQGYCSDCFNHTMTVISAYDHQLIIDAKDKELAEVRSKLEAAEARIKASQEQEPVAETGWLGTIHRWFNTNVPGGTKLYAQPPIPPELAELQRENAELRKQSEVREGFYFTKRQLSVIQFALRRFAWNARDRANEAGQDKQNNVYINPESALSAFLNDANDAEEILRMFSAAPKGE